LKVKFEPFSMRRPQSLDHHAIHGKLTADTNTSRVCGRADGLLAA